MTDEEFKYVVGQDPGGTTGIACLKYTDDTLPELIYLHQQEDGQAGYYRFFEGTQVVENVTYVSENFTIREGVHGADVTPLRIEGIQYALWRDNVVYQEPSQKKLVKDTWLKDQNLWVPNHRHAMDALIHAIVYLRNSGHKPTIEALSNQREEKIAEPGEAKEKVLNEDGSNKPEEVKSAAEKSAEAIERLREAMQEAAEAAQKAEEAMQGEADGDGDSEGEGEGAGAGEGDQYGDGEPTGSGTDNNGEYVDIDPDISAVRKRREKNGAFAGFEPDTQGVEVSLFND